MKTINKEKESQSGRRHCWLKAVLSCLLVASFSFSIASISQAQSSRLKKTAVAVAGNGGPGHKAAASAVSIEGQKVPNSGSQTQPKAKSTAAGPSAPTRPDQPAKAQPGQQAKPATSSIKGVPESTLQILKENRFLEEEFKLAKTPQYYFVLNLREKTLELRARGMVLKSWKASELRYTGKPVPLQVTTLTNKTALKPPERKVLNPAEQQAEEARKAAEKARQEENKKKKAEEEKKPGPAPATAAAPADSFELEALEITDMPGSYELNFDDGLRIFIRSKSGLRESFRQTREMLLWYTWYPVKHFLLRKSELHPQLILYFDNMRDAQGVYWAFIDGIKGIIWFP
ncbi:MAG: hypothetical protein NUW07_09515 [Candidatus Saccharicenans sp.]|jgi:hypothetical protein|nr:hypothetical protein [Candidatus Saccharicenans sp.]MDH7493991.1 hypothetical protein [Candidatus Saccharicenans sp.]